MPAKKSHDELIDANQLNAAIIQSAQQGIMVYDADLRIRLWNPFLERLSGLPAEKLLGRYVLEAFPFLEDQGVKVALENVLRTGQGRSAEREFWFEIESTGASGWVSTVDAPLFNAAGHPVGIVSLLSDITERKQTEASLRQAASVFTHASEGITITDPNGVAVDVNERFTKITGYGREEAIGQNMRLIRSGRQDKSFYKAMWEALIKEGHWSGELWNQKKDGTPFAAKLTITSILDEHGQIQNYVGLLSDMSQLKEKDEYVEFVTYYDTLTGLPNRTLLTQQVQTAIAKAQKDAHLLAIAHLDIDDFDEVNALHGNAFGNALLIAIADRLKAAIRENDILSRVGGDDFVVVMPCVDSHYEVERQLQKLTAILAEPFNQSGTSIELSVSAGVTLCPDDGTNTEQLLRQADQAMYAAKQSGRNRVHFFDIMQAQAFKLQNEAIEQVLDGIRRDEFVLYYQPKVNLRTRKVIGAEALIRWQHPARGFLAPGAFLYMIEDHPVSIALGAWVMQTALRQMEVWRQAGLNIDVSVNVSAMQLQQKSFEADLFAQLRKYPNLPAERLELEITESGALGDTKQALEAINASLAHGVRFSLDDFGTGYSSLSYLKAFPVHTIKIDQSFVRDMLVDSDDLAIVRGVIGLAEAFNRSVIAEGVETDAHGKRLLEMGCELAQGYGIAKPMPASELAEWIVRYEQKQNETVGP